MGVTKEGDKERLANISAAKDESVHNQGSALWGAMSEALQSSVNKHITIIRPEGKVDQYPRLLHYII